MRSRRSALGRDRGCAGTECRARRLAAAALFVALAVAAPTARANGPVAPAEPRHVPGQLLLKLTEPAAARLGSLQATAPASISPALAALSAQWNASSMRPLFPGYSPGQIKTLRAAISAPNRAAAAAPKPQYSEAELRGMAELGRWVVLEGDPTADMRALAARYAKVEGVAAAEPNWLASLVEAVPANAPAAAGTPKPSSGALSAARVAGTNAGVTPNDPMFAQQWGLTYIHAPEAWAITQGSPSQVIAIIDTGIDLDHPDLASKIWTNPVEQSGDANADGCPGVCGTDDDGDGLVDEDGAGRQPGESGYDASYAADDDENGYIDDFHGWNWVGTGEGQDNNDPQDDNGHGTHVAGIAAAATDNGVGIAGACPLCRVMPLKAFQSNGTATYADIAKALDYARRNGATVVSMSFGSYADSSVMYDALSLAYSRAVLVAAAGNDHRARTDACHPMRVAPFYPAHYPFVLGVEALQPDGVLASFSNTCAYEVQNPGSAILSAVLDASYASWSGTSMATPFVAGTAALLRDRQPSWGPDLLFGQLARANADALQVVSLVPQPDIKLVGYRVVDTVGSCPTCDGDGRPDSGETVDIIVTVRNWWGSADGVSGTLATSDALANVANGASSWGSVGPNASDDNSDNPFRVQISSSAGNNYVITLTLAVNASNGGSGFTTPIVLTVQRGLERSGVISADETWTKDNLYLVTGNLRVDPGVTLTIEPGTRVEVGQNVAIRIMGEIRAFGTPADWIVFSAAWIQTNGPRTAFDSAGRYVSGTGFEYCRFEGLSGGVQLNGHYLAKSIFRDRTSGQFTGAVVEGSLFTEGETESQVITAYGDGEFHANTVVGNGGRGAVIGSPEARGNSLFSNGQESFVVSGPDFDASGNYWGTTNPQEIASEIFDFYDDGFYGVVRWDPPLSAPHPDAPPVVSNITLDPPSPVSVGPLTITVTFSHPMNTSVRPEVFFGPAEPWTSHPVDRNGTWLDSVTYRVETDVTVFTGDGLQKITVVGAKDPEGFPLPSGDHRFGFEIVTSGTSSAQLNASGAVGRVDLSWFPSAQSAVAGYNLYRSATSGGPYTKLNGPIVASTSFADHAVEPGVPYYYVYRVVNTQMEEGPDSDEASAAALDDVPPVISHVPVTSASAGLPITIVATITDNVATPTARLYHRARGSTGAWDQAAMINATGSQYTANIPATAAVAPGREYYLEASDGVNTAQDGSPAAPHRITIVDQPTVASVSPDHGPLAGGTTVTITGTNVQAGATVRFGGVAATNVVRVDAQHLTCTTPAHYPAVVDVAVANPNAAVGTKTRAFTFDGSSTTLRLPTSALDRMSVTTLGVSTPGVEGLISASLAFTYDPAVLTVQAVGAGSLTSGWTVSANTSTPGTVQVSIAGTAPATGTGTLAQVTVQVTGNPSAVSPLTWLRASLNDGAIPATSENGQVTVNDAFDVSGAVHYYTGSRPVEGATLTLDGANSYSQATASDGSYSIANVPSDNYVLAATKSDGVSAGDVSALDASLVLQQDAGLVTLGAEQRVAADVDGSGAVTALDASYILQYAVGTIPLPFPGAGRIWSFSPTSRTYAPLALDQTAQDFTAILVGDVTGNWHAAASQSPSVTRSPAASALSGTATVKVGSGDLCAGAGTVPISLQALQSEAGLYAIELTLRYDPAVVRVTGVRPASLVSGWSLASKVITPGTLRIAVAGATPITSLGELAEVLLRPVAPGTSSLTISASALNEGAVVTRTVPGQGTACSASPQLGLFTVQPCRLVDTREQAGPRGGPALVGSEVRTFTLTDACGVPAGAVALSANVTVAGPAEAGHLTLFPGGTTMPLASTLNYDAGQVKANNAILPLNATGELSVFSSAATQLIIDVSGYFE